MSFRLVALLSTYREGRLAAAALDSTRVAGIDGRMLWEGPAGEERAESAPASEFDRRDELFRQGIWKTDAAKRTAMLEHAKRAWHDRPLWILLLDGDELLVNGQLLRDLVQSVVWADEARGASLADPANPPTGGIPLRRIDVDGSVQIMKARLLNAACIRRFVVSNLIFETTTGFEMRQGHLPEPAAPWLQAFRSLLTSNELPQGWSADERAALEAHLTVNHVLPPLAGEPYVIHRSHLRHPARQALRLHEAERAEIERLGYPV